MICSRCGRTFSSDLNVCPHCGSRFREPPSRQERHALGPPEPRSVPKERSPLKFMIVIVSLVVLVPIALSALVYFTVFGFGEDGTGTPSSSLLADSTSTGFRFTFSSLSDSIIWNDLAISLDGVSWSPDAGPLGTGNLSEASFGSQSVGALVVSLVVTDVLGNGMADSGDSFALETVGSGTFEGSGSHTVTVVYGVTSEEVCRATFSA